MPVGDSLEGATFDDMDESTIKIIAGHLRKPEGEEGANVGELMNIGNRTINEDTMRLLHLRANDRVLEVGMGNGHFVERILGAADGVTYAGCDYSDVMVKEAEKRNKASINAGVASFHCGSAVDMPYRNTEFDLIFTVNTIYFWDEPEAVLREFKRVLKPNGRLMIAFRPENVMKLYPMTRYNFHFWDTDTVTELVQERGFKVTDAEHHIEPPSEDLEGNSIRAENIVLTAIRLPD